MRIDAHQHFWIFDPVRDAWIDDKMQVIRRDFLPADLNKHLQENKIDGTIAVQADQSEDETDFLLKLAAEIPFIAGVVGWVDLLSASVDLRLEHYSQFSKLKGFRHIVQAEPDDNFMLRKDFQCGISLLNNFDFTYDILVYPKQLPAANKLVEKFPEQKFVLDHIAKPEIKSGLMEPWAAQIKELAKHKNVWCKISGIITEADHKNWTKEEIYPYLDVVFEAFDVDKLMFGSDWPVCLLAGSYEKVYNLIDEYIAEFTVEEKSKILCQNATRFYGV